MTPGRHSLILFLAPLLPYPLLSTLGRADVKPFPQDLTFSKTHRERKTERERRGGGGGRREGSKERRGGEGEECKSKRPQKKRVITDLYFLLKTTIM